MSPVRSATLALGLALGLAPAHAAAQTPASDAACATAYTKGQDDRLAGRLYAARTAFLSCSAAICPAVVATDCQRWASEVEADLPTIRVHASDAAGHAIAGLSVAVDGTRLGPEQLARPLVLESGPHTLRFEAPGYAPLELERALRPTDREIAVNAVFVPPAPPEPARPAPASVRRVPTASWVLAGVGAVALGSSAYFGIRTKSRYDELKTSCAPNCSDDQADSVRHLALASDVALLTSLAAFGAAAWVYLAAPSEPPKAALLVAPRGDGVSLGLRLSF